jgi:hypothetical protein
MSRDHNAEARLQVNCITISVLLMPSNRWKSSFSIVLLVGPSTWQGPGSATQAVIAENCIHEPVERHYSLGDPHRVQYILNDMARYAADHQGGLWNRNLAGRDLSGVRLPE